MKEQIQDSFYMKYHHYAEVVIQAPTRINIIGEHTDYNGGLVLPAAINHFIYFAFAKTITPIAFIYDENKDQQFSFDLEQDLNVKDLAQWRRYYYGAIKILQENHELPGFQVLKLGKAPIGAGISSSAALCCGFIYGLNILFKLGLDRWQIAKMARRVEQEYVGLQCGIMDQFAVLFGQANKALSLNCTDLSYTTHPLHLKQHRFLLCNSQVKHNLAESAYNERVEELNQVKTRLSIQYLQDARKDAVVELPISLQKRLRHFISENLRVKQLIEALGNEDYSRAGDLLSEGHRSLKEDYALTCMETDFLVDELLGAGALGARQMGGGFGGCVLALVRSEDIDHIQDHCASAYANGLGKEVIFYNFEITDGVKEMN